MDFEIISQESCLDDPVLKFLKLFHFAEQNGCQS